MSPCEEHDVIRVWRPTDLRQLELRRGFAVARPVPRHWHDEFQLCLIEDGGGELIYRRENYPTLSGSLFIVHPGEIHANRAFQGSGCTYRTLFIEPQLVRSMSAEIFGRDRGVPFFQTAVVFEAATLDLYRQLHRALEVPTSTLERESLLLSLSTRLLVRFGEMHSVPAPLGPRRPSIQRACEYLTEHHAENVHLEELARLVGLSPFHFSRVFCDQVGMPPHLFQTQVRVAKAKNLLSQGFPISRVAALTGFADQSHLNRHFKRLVGVTPGQYRQGSKNVQDPRSSPY